MPAANLLFRNGAAAIRKWAGSCEALYLLQTSPAVQLQDCGLHSIPRQLVAATALRRLRIACNGWALAFSSADLELFAALPHLTFVNVAKV